MKARVTRAQCQVERSEGLMGHVDTWGSVAKELRVADKAAGNGGRTRRMWVRDQRLRLL